MADEKPVPTTPETPPAAPPEIPDEVLRAKVKERWGIDDDPDTYKSKRQQEREQLDTIPRYQAALTELARRAQAAQAARTQQEQPKELDEATLRDQARLDPYVAIQYTRQQDRQAYDEKFQRLEQAFYAREWQASADRANNQLAEMWPEAHDKTSDLHKEGLRIFQSFSPEEQNRPDSGLRATQMAAGMLGLPPKSKRSLDARSVADDVAGQNTTRGSRTPKGEETPPALTDRQAKIAKTFGVKPKDYAASLKELQG